jgi:hypothetical protein
MEINDILDSLGIDLSNPESRKGAAEAINAILASRIDLSGLGGLGSKGNGGQPPEPIEVEVDPDLIQPSVKHPSVSSNSETEIEDDEDLLNKLKYNEPEDSNEESEESGNEGNESGEDTEESGNEPGEDSKESGNEPGEGSKEGPEEPGDEPGSNPTDDPNEFGDNPGENSDDGSEETLGDGSEENSDDDLLDDKLKKTLDNKNTDAKTESRRRKRERTLRAAKATLEKAKAAGAAPGLIAELENAIAALEALVEAANRRIEDLSDEEFNSMINRVFDAIDALNPGELTYSSEEERQAKVAEIKADLADSRTQAELSAEDAATIRAEHQAVKAKEAEADKYRTKSRHSFQDFQVFMNSLLRGIALQVSHNEERDDTWSAISRRNSGQGVLRQGQKINDLPTKKIPVIDFYFDQSGSWTEKDLIVGNRAVEALAKLKDEGKIKINVYYFANHVHENAADARDEGGTWAWNDIIKNIVTTNATNVVIMTDSDMERRWEGDAPLRHTVPGFVWYLWRRGDNAPRLPRDLQGRGGTLQYSC